MLLLTAVLPLMPTPQLPLAASQEPELAAAAAAAADEVVLGPKAHRYRWDTGWLKLDEGFALGNTHGCVCVDSKGRILFNTDSDHAVVIVNPDGTVASKWGAEWKGGLHGMTLVAEGDEEYLYLAHTGRHEVAKTTLDGEVLWTIGWPEESGKYENAGQYRPTAIAVASDGRIFVGDGYGQSWVHRYSKDREYLGSIGGPGTDPGKMRTPHGLVIEELDGKEYLLVCDRENHRLQRYDLDGNLVRAEAPGLRRPCNGVFTESAGGDEVLAIADLVGRVTLLGLDEKGERVVLAHLGDNPDPEKRAKNGVPLADWRNGEFLSPHGIGADADGNLYVMDWNRLGRITRLERVD